MSNNLQNLSKILSPQNGKCISLIEVPDEVFSEKILGDGIAIIPTSEEVLSPVDGEITQIAETNHAFCIKAVSGIELMIHIGIDTVKLKGKGFECFIKSGDEIKAGDLLVKANLKFIQENGFPIHTVLIVINQSKVQKMEPCYGIAEAGKSAVIKYIMK